MRPEEREEVNRENEKNFIEGYLTPTGPFKYLEAEQIKQIHILIDQKMQELEDSGLTRDEILYNQQKGLPLADDPFFQFVKKSRSAREMLIKPGEEFSMERVVEKALRQDIGPDPTLAQNRVKYKYKDENNPFFEVWEYKKKYRDKDPVLNEEAYLYDYNLLKRRQRQIDFDQEKPATFINRPLSRVQLRKKFLRKLKKSDIHWKNTPLILKFVNDTNKILNRYQTRLRTQVQIKLAKTIKKVRDLNLIPHVGLIKPTDRIPVGSFMEDMEEMHKKTIDPVSGRLFIKHSHQDSYPEKEHRQKEIIEERFKDVESNQVYDGQENIEKVEKAIRELNLDNEKIVTNRLQRQWLIAQGHLADSIVQIVSLTF